jgi:hypothetical protein
VLVIRHAQRCFSLFAAGTQTAFFKDKRCWQITDLVRSPRQSLPLSNMKMMNQEWFVPNGGNSASGLFIQHLDLISLFAFICWLVSRSANRR